MCVLILPPSLPPPSLSGYESESALVTPSEGNNSADTQALIILNSSLTRFIIMLDVWLSQVCACACACACVMPQCPFRFNAIYIIILSLKVFPLNRNTIVSNRILEQLSLQVVSLNRNTIISNRKFVPSQCLSIASS